MPAPALGGTPAETARSMPAQLPRQNSALAKEAQRTRWPTSACPAKLAMASTRGELGALQAKPPDLSSRANVRLDRPVPCCAAHPVEGRPAQLAKQAACAAGHCPARPGPHTPKGG
jgi:hypothetical protein